MALPIHDHTSSVANLARMVRDGLDLSQDMTQIRTASLKLLLDTLIRAVEPKQNVTMAESAQRSLASMIAPAVLDPRGFDGR